MSGGPSLVVQGLTEPFRPPTGTSFRASAGLRMLQLLTAVKKWILFNIAR